MPIPTRITLAEAAYARALADARARSTPAAWRRLVRAGENLRSARAEAAAGQRRRQTPILLVDDERESRDALRELLERHGHRVVTAEHGVAALDMLRRRRVRPGAIVLDLDLPHMNGHEVRQELLRDPALARIPVVVVSGSSDRSPMTDVKRVDKPVEPAALFAALSGMQTTLRI
jgi:CheY-like chemotaxis protein